MCQKHWRWLPWRLKADINNSYQVGQERGLVRPTGMYFEACRAAKAYISSMEGNK